VLAVALFQLDCFAGSFAKVIELRAFCFSASNRFDIENIRRMKREDALDALITHDSPNREGLAHAPPLAGNYGAAKNLSTLFIAFFYFRIDINHIAHLKMWYIFPETLALNSVQQLVFHRFSSCS
jgi:hypothetical protein